MSDLLPIELWIEVLSHLPRGFRRKMIGVSRALFELAMDDIYEEIILCADDDKARFAIFQLQYPNISRRVRRLVIFVRPDNPRKKALPIPQPCIGSDSDSHRTPFPKHTGSNEGKDSYARLLSIARYNLQSCFNLQDLKMDFSGSLLEPLKPYFKPFLRSLWHRESIGPRIRRLSMQASDLPISTVFEMFSVHGLSPPPVINIEELDLSFRHILYLSNESRNYHHIASFLSALERSLVSFTVSGYLIPHIISVFTASGTFEQLKKLELHSTFNVERDIKEIVPLQQFIARHSKTLEHLIIDPATREANSDLSSRLFLRWLSDDGGFPLQPLPKLHTLELAYQYHMAYGSHRSSSLFPNLQHICPNLTALSIKNIELNFDNVMDLFVCLPRPNGLCQMESLTLQIDILTPKLLDLLAQNLPKLASLELFIASATENLENEAPEQHLLCQRIRERKYPTLALKFLRITSSSSSSPYCHYPHPNLPIMEAVKPSLSVMSSYPYSVARSYDSGSFTDENNPLIASLLATDAFDEISTAEDFGAVERYIRNQGRVDSAGRTTIGLVFWVYPTGMRGPYHIGSLEDHGDHQEEGSGRVSTHGLLVTVERGAALGDAVTTIRVECRTSGISHVHIKKA
ncbi:hypothetical protein JR316_0012390 [Psilocybe cubensis]|uniref:Uncharacterized protein n=2 Tax=Psilocybe cubensis TaxID=181762 RepID=A0ACB8GJN9_PSICU|nr:hypothetical protein JR316_0012390 [Psilocybe cubensis]KAH9475279.1 hypothetical protein JR316_0012390 [Psilocybe cubensis]